MLPFALGLALAARSGVKLNMGISALGLLSVALIMAMTFLVNEYFDFETDSVNVDFNRFSGGSRVLPQGLILRKSVLVAAAICAALAIVMGLIIQYHFKTGPLTIPLGLSAMLIGYAYTGKPFQLIYRGWGELAIGVSMGWMPVYIAYYLLAGLPSGLYIHVMTLPNSISIVMALLINEYPDYISDKASGKRNFVMRFGREKIAWFYAMLGMSIAVLFVYIGFSYFSGWRLLALGFPTILSLSLSASLLAGLWQYPTTLEKLCLGTLVLNLTTPVILIAVTIL